MIEVISHNCSVHSLSIYHRITFIRYRVVIMTILMSTLLLVSSQVTAATSSAQVTESTLTVPYSGPAPRGPLTFPLYKGQNFQYFSAGVGIEERQLTYPPYQLKLILVEGTHAFLSNVSLTIRQLDGPLTFDIPPDKVEGPWVFLNIPTGTYLITAENYQDKKIEKQVSVVEMKPQVIYFRWPN
ncbi:MAG: hypothetical protein ACPGYT_12890 [Nitrospirales bacterium]